MLDQYEISLWTHSDHYITTLAHSGQTYYKGAFSPKLQTNTRGEISLSFTIPIVVYNKDTESFEDNTLWYNNLKHEHNLENEKKVKCIFNKGHKTNGVYDHKIIETVISKITERRDGLQLFCDVECTGLAFKWLGKIGFSLTLDSDTVLLEEEKNNTIIQPTIDYWLDKVFPKTTDGSWATMWSYKIDMNYSGIGAGKRQKDKVYEKDDIITWSDSFDGVEPVYNTEPIEKKRFITVADSNKYNITQDIAELFEIFVRYDFLYEDQENPYKITRGQAVFYNEMPEQTEYSIAFKDNEVGLSKESDSNEITTKMFVKPIESEFSDNGFISIADAPNNITQDNFILNFDYFKQSGQLTSRQEKAIETYQTDLRHINQELAKVLEEKRKIENSIVEYEIEVATLTSKISAAQEAVNDYTDKMSVIDTSLIKDILHDDNTAHIVKQDGDRLIVNLKRAGVIRSSIISETQGVSIIEYITNDYGNVTSLVVSGTTAGKVVFFSYDYDLLSYYRNELLTFNSMLDSLNKQLANKNKILGNKNALEKDPDSLYGKLDFYDKHFDGLSQQKNNINLDFENLMGYFLKEGSWVTNDYQAPTEQKRIEHCRIFYDTKPLPEEQLSYFISGVQEDKKYYDYILAKDLKFSNIEELVITEKWSALGIDYIKKYSYNAQYTPQFMMINQTPTFILLFDFQKDLEDHKIFYTDATGVEHDITNLYQSGSINHNPLCYRRYILPSQDNVIANSIKIISKKLVSPLKEFYDYNTNLVDSKRIITFKCNNNVPYNYNDFTVNYRSDRTTSQFFYDAQDVSKNSAFPSASYTVNFSFIKNSQNLKPEIRFDDKYKIISQKLNDQIFLTLGSIVRINDYQLNFNGVKGIVTDITYDLDQPQNSDFTIQNYKTRFEDLFGRIVASSEQMKSNQIAYNRAAGAITPDHQISTDILQSTIKNNSLIFSSGYTSGVSIDDTGIVVENIYPYPNGVTGQVVIKGGAIFLSDSVDANGNRIYHTGITPEGINASTISTGRLDADKVNIYSGDQIRFSWTGDGIHAYDKYESGKTNFNKFVKYNQDGLRYEDNGFTAVDLGWNGLYIGAQDGSVELTSTDGFVMYNAPKTIDNRTALLKLGRFNEPDGIRYGLTLYDNNGLETLKTTNNGKLWLKDQLLVGQNDGTVGISGETKHSSKDNPIRLWAGSSTKQDAPFWVKDDGSINASKATITGTIYATSGEFSGKIIAEEGTIGGWAIQTDSLSSGNMTLSSSKPTEQESNPTRVNVNNAFIVKNDGSFTATKANIQSGSIGNLTVEGLGQISNKVDNIAGDTNIITTEIFSSNGIITKKNKKFTTILSVKCRRGNIPFELSEYDGYHYKWEISDDGTIWRTIGETDVPTYEYTFSLQAEAYIHCNLIERGERNEQSNQQ